MTNSEQAKAALEAFKRLSRNTPDYEDIGHTYDADVRVIKAVLSAPVKQIEAGEDLSSEAISIARKYFKEVGISAAFFDDVAGLACREILELREKVAALSGQAKPPETREQRMRDFTTASGVHGWCDPEIYDLVKFLNENGFDTIASCSGHGYQPPVISFRDGREIRIFTFEQSRKVDKLFPDINGVKPPMPDEVREAVKYGTSYVSEYDNQTHDYPCMYPTMIIESLRTLILAVERGYQG